TAIDTTATIRAAVVAQLQQQPDVPVLVLTDHDVGIDVGIDDPRMVVIAPPAPLKNVGIAVLAARERPAAQVMVEVVNDLPPTAVDVEVRSGDQTAQRRIELPAGARTRVFVDMPALSETVEARLVGVADDLDADNVTYL